MRPLYVINFAYMASLPGHASSYSPELAERICSLLSTGLPLNQICKLPEMPQEATVRLWAIGLHLPRDYAEPFASMYGRARAIGLDVQVEAMMDIADDQSLEPNSRRVMVDTRKWLFAKMRPEKYGDYVGAPSQAATTINVNQLLVLPQPGAPAELPAAPKSLPAGEIIDAEPCE